MMGAGGAGWVQSTAIATVGTDSVPSSSVEASAVPSNSAWRPAHLPCGKIGDGF
jgi:hypothetical protein